MLLLTRMSACETPPSRLAPVAPPGDPGSAGSRSPAGSASMVLLPFHQPR